MRSKISLFGFGTGLEKLSVRIVGILGILFAFFLSVTSLIHTTAVETVKEGQGQDNLIYRIREHIESIIYFNDNVFLNLIVLGLSVFLCFLIARKCSGIKLKYIVSFLFLWTAALSIIWVISSQSAPSEDSWFVTNASQLLAENDYSSFNEQNRYYYRNYSFQLGYVLFNELIIRIANIFSPENIMYLEVLNGLFLAGINVFIILIIQKLFNDSRITNLTAAILALSAAPIISCSFIYGITPGMFFAVLSVYFVIRYLTDNKILFACASVLSISLAVLIKSNYIIWLIAIVIAVIVKLIPRKKYIRDIIFIVAAVGISMSVQPAVKSLYEYRADCDLGDSIPYASWVAMGLNESDLAPGWYNANFTVGNFANCDLDSEKASSSSFEEIKDRVEYFLKNPQYTNDFFYLKTVSQWNETSYQSIWNNTVRMQFKEKNSFGQWVCYDGASKVKSYMDYFAQLVFFGFLAGCFFAVRKKNFLCIFIPLIFLGGFFYHLISEGKSQYILPYFILMSGFAGVGIVGIMDSGIVSKIKKCIFTKENENESA